VRNGDLLDGQMADASVRLVNMRRRSMLERCWWVAALACSALFCWSASAQQGDAAQASQAVQQPAQSNVASQYIIGPGDTLQIFVWNHPELTVTVPVRPDGQLSTPLVENMPAAGKTASELARNLEGKLAEYVRSPTVNVIVTQPMSTFSQVKIIGQVAKPQAIPYRNGMTVMDVILAAGGLTEFAAGNRAKIVRTQDGKTQDMKVRLSDLVNKGDMKQNVAMQPGDVIVVPQSRF